MQQLSSVYRQHGLSTKGGLFTGCTATVGTVHDFHSELLFADQLALSVLISAFDECKKVVTAYGI